MAKRKKTASGVPDARVRPWVVTTLSVLFVLLVALWAWFQLGTYEQGVLDVYANQQDGYVQLVLEQIHLTEKGRHRGPDRGDPGHAGRLHQPVLDPLQAGVADLCQGRDGDKPLPGLHHRHLLPDQLRPGLRGPAGAGPCHTRDHPDRHPPLHRLRRCAF